MSTFNQTNQQSQHQFNIAGNYNQTAQPQTPLPLQTLPRSTYFVDREKALAQLLRDLQPGRVVTLCGPGGIGKTALAAEALDRLYPDDPSQPPERFPHGVIVHNFYQKPEVDVALSEIARALGEEPQHGPLAAAQRALQRRQALLILDGAERADRLATLLEIRGNCGVLVTSRSRRDAWERAQAVDPLPKEDAIALLQTWGGVYAQDEAVLAQISERVGHLPLALQIVGHYLDQQQQPAATYLGWLRRSPLEALNQGERRQESIPILLEHSLAELSHEAKLALGVVGLLALAPFDPALIGIAHKPLGHDYVQPWVDELVNYGLLRRVPAEAPGASLFPKSVAPHDEKTSESDHAQDARHHPGATHLVVSHPLIHTYIVRHLPRDPTCIRQLADYYTQWVEEQSALGVEGYQRLDGERLHILNTLQVCFLESCWVEAHQLVWAMEDYLDIQGHWPQRQIVLEIGIQAAQQLENHRDEGAFLGNLGLAYASLGEVEKAIGYYEQALEISLEIGHRRGQGNHLGNLGLAYASLGEVEKAIGYYEQALEISLEIGHRRNEGAWLGSLGLAYADLGEVEKAIGYYEQALEISLEIGHRRNEGAWLGSLGLAYADLGEVEKAIGYYEQALEISLEIGHRRGQGADLGNLGNAYASLGEVEKAIGYYEQALEISLEIGDRRNEGAWLGNLGLAYADLGEVEKAIGYYEQALDIS